MGKLTLKELAERLGVSVSAVSLAINGRPGLSDETRGRIPTEGEAARQAADNPFDQADVIPFFEYFFHISPRSIFLVF